METQNDPLAPKPNAVTNALKDVALEFSALPYRRITITLALLSAYLLGHFIPLHGLKFDVLGDMRQFGGEVDRVSLMALGVLPWATAVALIEFVGIVIPPLRRSLGFIDGHANPFHWFAILLTLIVALPQAVGVSIAVEAADMAGTPGTFFVAFAAANMIAGTIVCIALAKLIDNVGTGHGFWLVFGFSLPFAFLRAWEPLFDLSRSGATTMGLPLILDSVILVASVLIVCAIVRKLFHAGVSSPAPIVLPLLVAGQAASQVLALGYYLFRGDISSLDAVFIYHITAAILTAGLLWLSLRRYLTWPLIALCTIAFIAFSAAFDIHRILETGILNGWYFQTSVAQMAAFVASLAFIISGVYGRRNVVGKP